MDIQVTVNQTKCKGCRLCIEVCPQKILKISRDFNKQGYHFVEVDSEKHCTGCKRCVTICPDVAIELYQK